MPLPFSDVAAFRRDPLTLFATRAKSAASGLAPLHLAPSRIFLVTDAQMTRDALRAKNGEIDKGRLVKKLRPIVGDSLLTNVGDAHKRSKDAIHRHLQRNAVSGNLEKMVAIINGYVGRTMTESAYDTGQNAALALQLGCTAIFGNDVLSAADRQALIEAVQVVEAELAADMFRIVPVMPWRTKAREARIAHAREVVDLVVRRARTHKNASGLLAALEAAGLDDQLIADEIVGLLIAGHHTTGASITWLMYHMAADPAIAAIIADEADGVLDDLEAGDASALRRAPLSLAYVKEVLRLYPAGWWTSREVMKPVRLGEHDLKVGDTLVLSPWVLHRDEATWIEADMLSVERDYTDPAYMPFGVGARSCIGMAIAWFELQLITLQFASAFRLGIDPAVPNPTPIPSVTLLAPRMSLSATLRADEPFAIRMAA